MGQSSVLLPWLIPILLIFLLQHHRFVYSSTSISFSSAHDNHLCPDKQRLALFQFKQTLSINIDSSASQYCDYVGNTPAYPKTNQWKMSSDCCKWDGVACNPLTGDVIGLDLSCSQVVGILHSNSSLFRLPHLQRLDLASNDFSGSIIPREFGRFATSLTHLNLSDSGFSGPVPLEITHLSKLVSLDLSYNHNLILNDSNTEFQHQFLKFLLQNLTQLRHLSLVAVPIDSVLPRNLSSFSSLTFLDLTRTGLCGKLPHEIFFLPNLQTLKLGGRNVTGVLPQSNWSTSNRFSSTSLRELDLSYSTMLSEVPDIVGSLKSLKSLKLRDCNLSGSIPKFISNLTHLTELDLSENHLSGSVPKFISNLMHLTELDLSFNHLEGQIPDGFADLVHLRSLSLGLNKLIIGPFPSWVANLSQLVSLDLPNCSLMGPLPSNITGLQKLTHLNLDDNSLNGTISSWVFDLPLLEFLDLGSNQLKGQLSEFQSKSNSLEVIDLSGNELSGFVPQSIFRLVDLSYLDLSTNNLSGIVEIEMFSSLKKLESLSLSYNNHLSVKLSTTNNTTIINATFPNLRTLDLSSLKIKEFPYFLRAMENLKYLDLSNSQIHGRVPEWVPSKWRDSLYSLNLTSNFLEGSLPLWICNSSSLVYLYLSNNNFGGVLPHCLGNLSDSLSELDLSMNHFHGTIPSTLANLRNLRILNLQGNQFEGMVPSLGNCTYLQTLDLGSNKLKDTFPRSLETLPQLYSLILRSNEFHGLISISNISNTKYHFPNLIVMDLSNNTFTGDIPNVFGTFQWLEDLDLHQNDFHGTIPSTFAKGNLLRNLNLHDNHLQGAVPSSLANCAELKVLDLGKNQINDTFPNWLGTLPKLHVLVLSFNRLHGPINTRSMNKNPFPKLRIIDLSCNEFSGLLPELFFKNFIAMKDADENKKEAKYLGATGYYQSSVILVMKGVTIELERIITTLTTIDLSSNKFKGEIPDVIGNLKFLRQLNLSHNSLFGRIPSLLGNLSKLESLDLNSNQLVGEIPQELANLNSLETLNLSHNHHLRGRIPLGKQFNTFLSDSYYGNLALCGFPLSDCEKGEIPPVLKEENDSDFMDDFTWEAVLMGYGCGTVLGFVIGYIMFLVGKPKWFTGIVERELHRMVRRPQRRGYKCYGRRN